MRRTNLILLLVLLALVALKISAGFLPENVLWGFDFGRFLPSQLQIIILTAVSVICLILLATANQLNKIIYRFQDGLSRNMQLWFSLLISIIGGVVFYIFRVKLHFLGDGYIILRSLLNTRTILFREPLDVLIHQALFQIFTTLFKASVEHTYIIVSIICGMLYVYISARLFKYLGDNINQRLITLLMLLSTPILLLFFGYVESYSIITVFVLAFFLSGLKSIQDCRPPLVPSLLVGLLVVTHLSTINLLPALIFLWVIYSARRSETENKLLPLTGAALFIFPFMLLAVAFAMKDISFAEYFNYMISGGHLLSLTSNNLPDYAAYSLFSMPHLVDILNELLLIAPFFFLSLAIFAFHPVKLARDVDSRWYFVAIGSLTYLALLLLINMKKGASRDWDLLAAMAIPLILLTSRSMYAIKPKISKPEVILLIFLSLLHFIPWISVNFNGEFSLKRFKLMTRDVKWQAPAKGEALDELRNYYESIGELDSAFIYAKRSAEAYENARYFFNWGVLAYKLGYDKLAKEKLKETIERKPDYLDAYLSYSGILFREEKYNDALKILQQANSRFQTVAIHTNMALNYEKLERFKEAAYHYLEVTRLEPGNYEAHLKLILMLINEGRYDKALSYCKEALESFQTAALYFNTALVYQQLNKMQEAGFYYQKAIQLDPDMQNAYYNLGEMLIKNKQFEEASAILEIALKKFETPEVYFIAALLMANLEKYGEAEALTRKSLALDPNFEKAMMLLQKLEKIQNR